MSHIHKGHRMLRVGAFLPILAAVCLGLAGCGAGSSSENAQGLLRATFSGTHPVKSGKLNVALSVNPSGSRTLTGPIALNFGGPFQSRGAGKLPQSAFTIKLTALGNSGSVAIISTGTHGYVSFQGSSYQLPQADFQKLESSFSQLASSAGSSGKSGVLGKLGINPMHWLTNPQVVGTESVGGVPTTHIHAGINVNAFLGDFNTFLQKASSLNVPGSSSLSHGLSASTISAIAGEIQNPSFDVWTGNSDKTLRRVAIHLTLPVSGQISTLLGGLRSAGIGLSMDYSDLNQPQTINAPSSLQPYSQFQAKLGSLITAIRGQLSSAVTGGAGAGPTGGTTGGGTTGGSESGGTSNAGQYQAYSQCIQAAGGDVAKMQRCASKLGSGK
jgi:hypothetical protein